MTATQRLSADRSIWFEGLPDSLEEAVDEFELENSPDWQPLADLSSATRLIGVDVAPEAAVHENGQFYAPATVAVELVYDPGADEVSFYDSYPARIYFDLVDRKITVTRVTVDTSSFYE